jgi:hypothetical protein
MTPTSAGDKRSCLESMKRMERACDGVSVCYRTLIRNDGISDLFKKKSDGVLAQKVATMYGILEFGL